jgi:hypothetical protein
MLPVAPVDPQSDRLLDFVPVPSTAISSEYPSFTTRRSL